MAIDKSVCNGTSRLCDIHKHSLVRWIAGFSPFFFAVTVYAAEPPRVLNGEWEISEIAAEPALVTPVGCCFDNAGRLLVVECHTHFPPEDWTRPKSYCDRILESVRHMFRQRGTHVDSW